MARRARKTRRKKAPSAERTPRRGVWAAAVGGLLVLLVTVTVWLLAIWVGRGAGSGAPAEEAGVRREGGLDVLLITVDTLRADALGAYGKAGAETLWLDRLAAGGVRFDDAHAHNVLTLPSHVNILSGLYPQEHGVRDNSGFRVPRRLVTLASVLRGQGYRTGAFVSAFPLDSRFGLGEGFDVYEDSFADTTDRTAFLEQERRGTETVALAKSWLAAAGGRPSFCWVHLYEPHFPYAPPPPFAQRFRDDPYQGEVAAADAALGLLLEPILNLGDAGKTLVVMTSDHGEALGEHGEATHGIFAYESTLRVPLLLYQPRLLPPRSVAVPVGHVDVLPTVLDALGLRVPQGVRGRSLLPMAAGEDEAETPATYFEALSGQLNRGWAPLYGVLSDGMKYVDLPIPELYDLRADPREEHNLASAEPRRLAALRGVLEPLRSIDPGVAPSPESAEVRERLESLGYLAGASSPTEKTYTEDDDPKRLIVLDDVMREVAGLHAAGDLAAAVERARELVRRRPGMRLALLDLAQLEREAGHLDAAVGALRQALAINPEDPVTLALLGACLTQSGRAEEAVEVTEANARLPEADIDVLLVRGLALGRLGRPREALAAFEKAREADPTNPKVPVHVGTLYLMGGQRDKAREHYEQALALNPNIASAHVSLALMASEDGLVEEALDHWRAAVAAEPAEHAKLLAVGLRLWNAGRQAEGRPLLELFASEAPEAAYREEVARVRGMLAAP